LCYLQIPLPFQEKAVYNCKAANSADNNLGSSEHNQCRNALRRGEYKI
jgi:hypothetical protein